jgi:hypothetical protein
LSPVSEPLYQTASRAEREAVFYKNAAALKA